MPSCRCGDDRLLGSPQFVAYQLGLWLSRLALSLGPKAPRCGHLNGDRTIRMTLLGFSIMFKAPFQETGQSLYFRQNCTVRSYQHLFIPSIPYDGHTCIATQPSQKGRFIAEEALLATEPAQGSAARQERGGYESGWNQPGCARHGKHMDHMGGSINGGTPYHPF